jgi:hypothetical protein
MEYYSAIKRMKPGYLQQHEWNWRIYVKWTKSGRETKNVHFVDVDSRPVSTMGQEGWERERIEEAGKQEPNNSEKEEYILVLYGIVIWWPWFMTIYYVHYQEVEEKSLKFLKTKKW